MLVSSEWKSEDREKKNEAKGSWCLKKISILFAVCEFLRDTVPNPAPWEQQCTEIFISSPQEKEKMNITFMGPSIPGSLWQPRTLYRKERNLPGERKYRRLPQWETLDSRARADWIPFMSSENSEKLKEWEQATGDWGAMGWQVAQGDQGAQ